MSNRPSSDSSAERPLPNNLEAERSVLGAILVDNLALSIACDKVTAYDFFYTGHVRIFQSMCALHENSQPIDLITLTEQLHKQGELDAAGGGAYLAQLLDGVPHVVNVGHYACIVKEKSQLRELIHGCHAIQQQAWEAEDSTDTILGRAAESIRVLTSSQNGAGHHPIKGRALLQLDVQPPSFVIEPILPLKGIMLLYSKEGVGKTLIGLEMAIAIATASETGHTRVFGATSPWLIPKPRRVLYVDGEMPSEEVKERFEGLCLGRGQSLIAEEVDNFELITPDLEEKQPNIVTVEGQQRIERHLKDGDVLVADNLSCLGHVEGVSTNEAESWWGTQAWLLRLRRRSITSIVLHHAGKSGDQLGTAAKKFVLHTVIQLKHPSDYTSNEGLRCEVTFQKVRKFKAKNSMAFVPFELKMEEDPRGALFWMRRPLQDILEAQTIECLRSGMTPTEIEKELGINRRKIYRIGHESGLMKPKQ